MKPRKSIPMYIKQLNITNFRIFKSLTLHFNKGVNILIGENNAGKSAVIDALRICLGYGKSDYMVSVKGTDLHINPNDPEEKNKVIGFDLIFEIEDNPIEKQCFYDFISIDETTKKETIQLHLKFTWIDKGKQKYFKREIWGGDNEHQLVPYEALQEIFFTYLDPLRDAIYGLRPYSYYNKTAQLFNELTSFTRKDEKDSVPLDDNKKKTLADELNAVFENKEKDWKYILETGNSKVNDHLKGTGITNKYPDIKMNFVGRKYSDIVNGIELKRPIFKDKSKEKQQYFELYQNGLGENNLIYASVVLGDLINRCEDKELQIYNALLVEEPEAHLHPQYQNTFFEYLNTLQNKGLQIFITSHSPTITAKSSVKNVTILQKQDNAVHPFSFSSLSDEEYSPKNRRYLRKFLDTTKSQMFFSNGVLLVEGIAEAILIPVLSKKYLSIDLEKDGIEIVNIGGVAFEHFAKLFNNDSEEKRLLTRCAIITDSDPAESKPKSDRTINAEKLEKKNLIVRLATNTFEHDLFEASESNKKVMRFIYRTMHSSTIDLENDFTADDLMKKLDSNSDKGDFALELKDALCGDSDNDYEEIKDDLKSITVPDYIEKSIRWVTKKDQHV